MLSIFNFLMLTKVNARKGGHCSGLLSLHVISPSMSCKAFSTSFSRLPKRPPTLFTRLLFSHRQKSLCQVGLIKMPCWRFWTFAVFNPYPSIPLPRSFFDLNLWNPLRVHLCCSWLSFALLTKTQRREEWWGQPSAEVTDLAQIWKLIRKNWSARF